MGYDDHIIRSVDLARSGQRAVNNWINKMHFYRLDSVNNPFGCQCHNDNSCSDSATQRVCIQEEDWL